MPDSVTLVHTEDAAARWDEVQPVVDTAPSSAISRFSEDLA
ncbi:hypothetical protein [Streptomyces sp. JJ36]|nr:hypothetical protein [Streptomyces sp. JJ36]